jgi:hypothetical protein
VKVTYFLFAGGSDKVPLQVMKNETVVVASAHHLLGSPLGSESGREMREDDYFAAWNTV